MKQNSGDATGQVGTIHNVNVNDLGHYLTIDTENNQPYNTWIEVPVDNGGGVYEYYYVNFKLLNDAFTAASGQPDGKFVQYMTNSTAIDEHNQVDQQSLVLMKVHIYCHYLIKTLYYHMLINGFIYPS